MNRSQAEPRLQESNTTNKVTSGFSDPCLVFLEANDQGFPILVACWARSSENLKKTSGPAQLELSHVLVCGWYSDPAQTTTLSKDPSPWIFKTGALNSLQIEGSEPEIRLHAPGKNSPFDSLGLSTHLAYRIHVRHLTQEEMGLLDVTVSSKKMNHVSLANLLFKLGRLDWPSVSEASRSLSHYIDRKEMPGAESKSIRPIIKLGNLLTIADQIQAFGFARKTGEIYVSNVPSPARMSLVDGQIVDAQFGLLSGIEAATALINLKDPETEFMVGERAHRHTIDLPFMEILCEAARVKDESPAAAQPVIPVAPLEGGMSGTPFLRITLGAETKTYPIRPGITKIGRSIRNDIVISDTTISQLHATLEFSPQGILLKDLNSTNGTFVAGEAIAERWLGTQDSLQFGGVHCLVNGVQR